ncbi:MAG: hypothetical protein HYY05_05220 [Chloroflexi bacterium]|nr:hypothetical protein [Chloroflexota bacterium]
MAICNELVQGGCEVRVTLTDRFPNLCAFRAAQVRASGRIDFVTEPVDATAVPGHLKGLRTMFAALHHFRPETVRGILQDAADQARPIAVFDLAARTPPPPSMMGFMNPLGQMLVTPFVRPFRWTRLLWTYAIPVAPLYVAWDAFVSGLRLYSLQELRAIVESMRPNDHIWEIGQLPFPRSITYLVGRPRPPKTMSAALPGGQKQATA